MRHDIPFPIHNDYEICHYLKNIWECGWLDEYSDEHFLIKAIENRLTTFVGYTQMLNNEPNLHGVIKASSRFIDNDTFNSNFCMNLSGRLACLGILIWKLTTWKDSSKISCRQENKIITKIHFLKQCPKYLFYIFIRSGAGGNKPCMNLLLANQSCQKIRKPRFIYELSLNGDAQKITINIEVKCPKFPSIENQECKKLRYLPFCFLMKVEKKFQHSARIMGLSI